MANITFDNILQVLIEEFRKDSLGVVEQEGVHYARLSIELETASAVLSEINLTRLADTIVRRLA